VRPGLLNLAHDNGLCGWGNIVAQARHRKYYRKRPYFAHEFCDAETSEMSGAKSL
jgi:hypothetical protein